VQGDLHLQLFLLDAAIFLSIFLIDEFDGEDGRLFSFGGSLLDTVTESVILRGLVRAAADKQIYHAYAPAPIVLDTKRNGTLWVGKGASCECWMPFIARAY
jgi:hypothetical protein